MTGGKNFQEPVAALHLSCADFLCQPLCRACLSRDRCSLCQRFPSPSFPCVITKSGVMWMRPAPDRALWLIRSLLVPHHPQLRKAPVESGQEERVLSVTVCLQKVPGMDLSSSKFDQTRSGRQEGLACSGPWGHEVTQLSNNKFAPHLV